MTLPRNIIQPSLRGCNYKYTSIQAELARPPLFFPEGFKIWITLPRNIIRPSLRRCNYKYICQTIIFCLTEKIINDDKLNVHQNIFLRGGPRPGPVLAPRRTWQEIAKNMSKYWKQSKMWLFRHFLGGVYCNASIVLCYKVLKLYNYRFWLVFFKEYQPKSFWGVWGRSPHRKLHVLVWFL